ncbi:MAG: hypothetical protein PHI11_10265 [Gallionella sp.]|nr:hypothetical protein [Gallionella sp.]
MEFSMPLWREYCFERVERNTDEQKLRFERLLDARNPENEIAWANLAADVRSLRFIEADGTPYNIEWREALHNVIGHLILPPRAITPTPKAAYKEVYNAALALHEAIEGLGEAVLVDQRGCTVLHKKMTGLEEVIKAAHAAMQGRQPLPLMAGKNTGENAYRNWLSLYIKERIIAVFFNKPHHEDIARLVNSALNDYTLTADAVRLLKPRSRNHP